MLKWRIGAGILIGLACQCLQASDWQLNLLSSHPLQVHTTHAVHLKITHQDHRPWPTSVPLQGFLIDPSLQDYQSITLIPGPQPGEFSFSWTPHTAYPYRLWVNTAPPGAPMDLVLLDLLAEGTGTYPEQLNRNAQLEQRQDHYHCRLEWLNTRPSATQSTAARLIITDPNGRSIRRLQPHFMIMGFHEDFQTLLPIQADLDQDNGTEAAFRLNTPKAGFMRLFAVVKIAGQEEIIPFGIVID